jgi:hypothetical protein
VSIECVLTDPRESPRLGSGVHARLQIEWLHALRPLTHVKVWGGCQEAAEQLAADLRDGGIDAHPASLEDAAGSAKSWTARFIRTYHRPDQYAIDAFFG